MKAAPKQSNKRKLGTGALVPNAEPVEDEPYVPTVADFEEDVAERPAQVSKRESSIQCLEAVDILPPAAELAWSVAIDSPAFFNSIVSMCAPMLPDLPMWICNNTAADRVNPAGPKVSFSGISIDAMDSHLTAMIVARMPLSPECVNIYPVDGEAGPREEVGITVSVKALLTGLRGIKEYQKMVMYQEKDSDKLSMLVVSAARDPFHIGLPLRATEAKHETVNGWDMQKDMCMSLVELKEVVRKAAMFEANSIHFEMKRWEDKGLIFVMSTDSSGGNLFKAFQVTYTTALKKDSTPAAERARQSLDEARQRMAASNPDKDVDTRRTESGLTAAERVMRQHLFTMYDTYPTPAGYVRPPRVSVDDTPLVEVEREVRDMQAKVRQYESSHKVARPGLNAAELLENVDTTLVEVAGSYCNEIRDAPFKHKAIMELPSEYDAWFSVKKLQDMLKTPQSASVQLHLPCDSASPIAIRFDTGGGGSQAFIACILAPRVDIE